MFNPLLARCSWKCPNGCRVPCAWRPCTERAHHCCHMPCSLPRALHVLAPLCPPEVDAELPLAHSFALPSPLSLALASVYSHRAPAVAMPALPASEASTPPFLLLAASSLPDQPSGSLASHACSLGPALPGTARCHGQPWVQPLPARVAGHSRPQPAESGPGRGHDRAGRPPLPQCPSPSRPRQPLAGPDGRSAPLPLVCSV